MIKCYNPMLPPDDFDTTIPRMPKLSVKNQKLSSAIPAINLPPIVTCNRKVPCFEGCYALRGSFLYKNVRNNLWNNYYAYLQNPDMFFKAIKTLTALYNYVRWFSSGDIVDDNFFLGMVRVARKNKNTKYLCFTKQYEIVNSYLSQGKRIPSNLIVVFSAWKDFIPDNPYNLPMSFVRFNDKAKSLTKKQKEEASKANALIPKKSFPCSGACADCVGCWNLKKNQSVVFDKH